MAQWQPSQRGEGVRGDLVAQAGNARPANVRAAQYILAYGLQEAIDGRWAHLHQELAHLRFQHQFSVTLQAVQQLRHEGRQPFGTDVARRLPQQRQGRTHHVGLIHWGTPTPPPDRL